MVGFGAAPPSASASYTAPSTPIESISLDGSRVVTGPGSYAHGHAAPDLLNFQLANSPSGENLACRHPGADQDCLCRLVELRAGGEEMRAARLNELEEMLAKLLETARKLPSG